MKLRGAFTRTAGAMRESAAPMRREVRRLLAQRTKLGESEVEMFGKRSVVVVGLAIVATLGGALACAGGGLERGASSRQPETASAPICANRGRALYVTYCAACHGNTGRGDGASAYLLSPAPRDFGSAKFRLVSTLNGAPTDEDLLAVLKRGMPGSAMPPWEWMADSDLRGLVQYVRELAIAGRADDLQRRAAEDDEVLERSEAVEIAARAMTPGEPIPVPPDCGGDALDLQLGRRFFLANCAQCHGADGTGKGGEPQINEDGTPAMPRDFTAGILKGGASHEAIVRRMTAGLPGSPMPATSFEDPAQAAQVSAYVRSLIKPGVQERLSQERRELVAKRIATKAPTEPADPAWSQAEAEWLPAMPLWWRDSRLEGCIVRAVHDGETLSVKISWEDAAKDDELLGQNTFTDAVALQWFRGPQPPLFTMGEPGKPVNIWQWRAGWELDLERVRELAARYPNMPTDVYGHVDEPSAPLYMTARAAGNAMAAPTRASAGEMLTAEGFGTLAPLADADWKLDARGSWASGFWDVVLARPLVACCPGELPLEPGASAFLAVALWDGAREDRNGQKSVTVWHVLHLEK